MIKRGLSGLILGAAACGGDAPAPVADAAGDFTTPAVMSAASNNGATPMFLVTRHGGRVLSWVAAEGGGTEGVLHLRVETPGQGVVTSSLVDPLGGIEPHGEAPPQVAADGAGTIYALYTVGKDVGARFPKSALRFARSADGGASWSAPVTVNEGEEFGSHNFHALLAGTDGHVYAAWLSSVEGKSGVWLRTSADGGVTWGKAHAIHEAPTCPCCRTALALGPDGTLYASWRKIFDGDVRDIVVMASKDHGATWSAPVKPRDDGWVYPGCPHAGASMKADATGAVHVAWWTGKGGAAGVWYARSSDGGATWAAQPIDTAATSAPAHVQVTLADSGRVIVAWDDGKSASPRILVRASGDGGTSFGATRRVSPEGVAATFPVLAVHHDSITVAWSQTADSAYRAAMAARPDMKRAGAKMGLPRVGQQEVLASHAALRALLR